MQKIKKYYFLTVLLLAIIPVVTVLFTSAGCQSSIEAEELTFEDLVAVEEGERVISDKAKELEGEIVTIKGWMSPLSPFGDDYFYLISTPSADCPFCAGLEVDYFDVIIVHLGERYYFTFDAIEVTGILDVGLESDGHEESVFRLIEVAEMEEL